MFKKLRIQLTLFNLLVITVMLALFAFAAFIGSPVNDPASVNLNMLQFALSGELPESRISNYRNHQGGLARIQLNPAGQLSQVNSELDLEDADYQNIISRILQLPDNSGTISPEKQGTYIYLRVILDQTNGPVIVLQKVISTAQSFHNFISRTGPVLLVTLILIFFASLSITQRALIPVREAWQKQVDFTSDASHELRTPLSVIQTNLECATDTPDETISENEQWFNNIKAETIHMTKLVNDLLTLFRSDSGVKVVNKEDFDLERVLEDTVNGMKTYAEKKGIILQSFIQPRLKLYGDKELLNRLTIILLDNAIKYTPAPGKVELYAKQDGSDIVIKVSDTGVGIDKKHIDKIFDRFYRADTARSGSIEGSGLGLSIAKWIVTEHKGSITVNSEPGRGTEITVLIST